MPTGSNNGQGKKSSTCISHRQFYGHYHDLVDRYGISVSQMTTHMFHLSYTLPGPFLFSWFITGLVTRLIQRGPLVKQERQELFILPKHLSSPRFFVGLCVTGSLVLCVCVVDRCLFFSPFSFGHCVLFPSSIYGFWLPLWYFMQCINWTPFKEIFQHCYTFILHIKMK